MIKENNSTNNFILNLALRLSLPASHLNFHILTFPQHNWSQIPKELFHLKVNPKEMNKTNNISDHHSSSFTVIIFMSKTLYLQSIMIALAMKILYFTLCKTFKMVCILLIK